ncbi:hypothetical protein [Streptomyces bohaiensis]|uniref:hypothetical protein n=1 Tax=Streptomyces bohaiensis TaxID=1431344 RepID=UPI003B7BFA5C
MADLAMPPRPMEGRPARRTIATGLITNVGPRRVTTIRTEAGTAGTVKRSGGAR